MEQERQHNKRKSGAPLGRRAVALLLSLLMIMSCMSIQVWASAEDTDAESSEDIVVTEVAEEGSGSGDEETPDDTPDENDQPSEETPAQTPEPTTEQTTQTETPSESNDSAPAAVSEDLFEDIQEALGVSLLSDPEPIDLEQYITDSSTMEITVYINGIKYTYTPDELNKKGLTVPKGAPVKVKLNFSTISNVKQGQTLEYQLPDNLMDYSGADEAGYVWKGVVWEENTSGALVEAADWHITDQGKLVVILRDDFFNENKHSDGTIDLFGFNVSFSGSFSEERGEHSGGDDAKIEFRGETGGTGEISFEIPFEYRNEHANVHINKEITKFDPATRTATYTVTLTAPSTNTYAAESVVVTDTTDTSIIEQVKDSKNNDTGVIYRNAVPSTGEFDNTTGVWTVGSMDPGQVETITYDLVISEDYYRSSGGGTVDNLATVTFNKDGKNESEAQMTLPGTVQLNKSIGTSGGKVVLTTENGEIYVTYTITATAYGGTVNNITVEDAFQNVTPQIVKRIEVPLDGASQGTVSVTPGSENNPASMVWTVGTLNENQTATLTYRAYLDPDAWQLSSINANGTASRVLTNNAEVYVGSTEPDPETGEEPIPYDTASVPITLSKTWVTKGGTMITTGEKKDLIKYTVKVNSDPVSGNIKSIYDVLTNGTYESGGSIELTRYKSSTSMEKIDTTTIPLSEVVTTGTDDQRWDIDLVARGLSGSYYYELTYYVSSSAVQVSNKAGIGFGSGPGYDMTAYAQGSGGMSWGSDFSKDIVKAANSDSTGINYKEGYAEWKVTINKTIEPGYAYNDYLDPSAGSTYDIFWFSYDNVNAYDAVLNPNGIKVEFGGKIIEPGEDTYTIIGMKNSAPVEESEKLTTHYPQFQIHFNRQFLATSTKPLTITYRITINNQGHDQSSASDYYYYYYKNRCWWYIPVDGVENTRQISNTTVDKGKVIINKPLQKRTGEYDKTTGTITWNFVINEKTMISGDAILEEYIPEGLTYVGVEKNWSGDQAGNTTIEKISEEPNVTNSSGQTCTKVTFKITGLVGYKVTSGGKTVDTNATSTAGQIQVKITTKVNADVLMNMNSKAITFNNEAILKGAEYLPENGVKATASASISTTQTDKQVQKDQASKENPAYIQYALNINPNALDIAADSDTLQVVDVMGTGMSLALDHTSYFQVYDITNVSGAVNIDGSINVSVAKTGTDVTDQCTLQDVTGQEIDGKTEDQADNATYLITVPDSKHLAVIYWATFEGGEGDDVSITNTASFYYSGKVMSNGGSQTSGSETISVGDASLYTGCFFTLNKTDQWGNLVPGVTYMLSEVTMNSDGSVASKTVIYTKTTNANEAIYFGHRIKDNDNAPELTKDTLYCLEEVSAPAGYTVNSEPYYFEFKSSGGCALTAPSGFTLHQFVNTGKYSFTNQFEGVSYQVPVSKTINGKSITSSTEFSFNLKLAEGSDKTTVYTNDTYSAAIPSEGLTATIAGSGQTTFSELYFKEVGDYTFTLTEDDLSDAAVGEGYTKDSTVYTVVVTVGVDGNNALTVTGVTFTPTGSTGDILAGNVPVFNNTSTLTGSFTLNLTKEVTGRAQAVQEGEFGFTVSVGGKVIAEKDSSGNDVLDENGKPVKKVFYTQEGGAITIPIDIDQDDVGTNTYVISEVTGDDETITYTTDRVMARVTVSEAGGGKVEATSIEYVDDNSTFTNTYKAEGSLTLTGTKILTGYSQDLRDNEFEFVVKEGDTQVATGTNAANGVITFSEITYYTADIGEHTYTITEKDTGELFVEYDTSTITATVTVTDAGNGKLDAAVVYNTANGKMEFTNKVTGKVPTGVNLDILPYALALTLAAGATAVVVVRKSKGKK